MSPGRRTLDQFVSLAAMSAFLVAIGVLSASALARSPGPSGDSASAADDARIPSGLTVLHALIERAFVRCDAGMLQNAFSRRIKTHVASGALTGSEGYYGADQLVLLFKRLFQGRTTLRFNVLTPAPMLRSDGRAVLATRWTSSGPGSTRHEVSLTFVMAPDGKIWRIREIRDLK